MREIRFKYTFCHKNKHLKLIEVLSLNDIENGAVKKRFEMGFKIFSCVMATNFEDKDGKDIFEGDVIEAIDRKAKKAKSQKGIVYHHKGGFCALGEFIGEVFESYEAKKIEDKDEKTF